MRLAPVVMFFHPRRDLVLHFAAESSRTTHGAVECLEACRLFAELLQRALDGGSRDDILSPIHDEFSSGLIQAIADLVFVGKKRSGIRSSGYVVHSLEAALWCFSETRSFGEAVLLAANLGDDADTTAAVCGQLAGAHYGASRIPGTWLAKLVMHDQIALLADGLRAAAA
jgi:ADP-ribosyl-[dinitrogen reductase] hydrolase